MHESPRRWTTLVSQFQKILLAATKEAVSRQANVTETISQEESTDEVEGDDNGESNTQTEDNETRSVELKGQSNAGSLNRVLSSSAARPSGVTKSGTSKSSTSSARKVNNVQWVASHASWAIEEEYSPILEANESQLVEHSDDDESVPPLVERPIDYYTSDE